MCTVVESESESEWRPVHRSHGTGTRPFQVNPVRRQVAALGVHQVAALGVVGEVRKFVCKWTKPRAKLKEFQA